VFTSSKMIVDEDDKARANGQWADWLVVADGVELRSKKVKQGANKGMQCWESGCFC